MVRRPVRRDDGTMHVRRKSGWSSSWWWVSGVAMFAAVVAVLVFFYRGPEAVLEKFDKMGSVGSLLLGAAALVLSVITFRIGLRQAADQPASIIDMRSQTPPGQRQAWNIPVPVDTFLGRDDDLARVDAAFAARPQGMGAVALHGAPGVGKSQLALAWAHRHAADVRVGWRVRAADRVTVTADLAELADRLGVGSGDQEEAAAAAIALLSQQQGWLLIFDDAVEPAKVAGFLPPGGGRVLITSRNPLFDAIATPTTVEPFDAGTAAGFLTFRARDEDAAAARELAAMLGGLPLALEQAGAYCRQTGRDLAGYLTLYRSTGIRLLEHGTDDRTRAVTVTVRLSLQLLARRDPAAAQLLLMMAFLAPTGIPRDLAATAAHTLPLPLRRTAAQPARLDHAVRVLLESALAATDRPGQLRVHQLVQDILRTSLPDTRRLAWVWRAAAALGFPGQFAVRCVGRRGWERTAARLVLAAMPYDTRDPREWNTWAALVPHGQAVIAHAGQVTTETGTLHHRLADYLEERGEYGAAITHLRQAVATRQLLLGDEHTYTLSSVNNLALVLSWTTELGEARQLHEQTLQTRRRVSGDEHLDTLVSMNNLALVLRATGDLSEARRLHEQTLEVRRRVLGDEHPDTLTSMNNLALVLSSMGELSEARRLHEQELSTCRRVLGDEHPDTLTSINNLALVLRELGELSEARRLHEQELSTCRRVLGDEHPHTLTSTNNLAVVLGALGELSSARLLHEQTLEVRRRVLGDEHPDTLMSMDNLTAVLDAIAATAGPPD
jgi:tetratricopeptide (TPR) repeat protein